MSKKKYRIDALILNKDTGTVCGNCHNVVEFDSFFNENNINDIVAGMIKDIEDKDKQKGIFSICIQNISPYNLKDWR